MDKSRIEQAKRIKLSALVAALVKLRPGSGGFTGLCPFHAEKTPSFHVSDARGTFKCFGCGAWGDPIDWIMQTRGATFAEAIDTLLGQKPSPCLSIIERKVERENDDSRRIRHAHDLWLKREPIAGTLAERYLRDTRGIRLPHPEMLGYVLSTYCSVLGEETEALIAPLQDSQGHVTAVQQIFLCRETLDAWRDPNGRRIKRTLGAMRDGAVRLGLPDTALGISGSVEDAMAASALYSLPVWAVCGEQRLSRVWIPPEIEALLIFADNDAAGQSAAREAAQTQGRGRKVTVVMPENTKDFAQVAEMRLANDR